MTTRAILLAALCGLLAATSLEAQASPTTWRSLLEARVRPSYRYTHPVALDACPQPALPATALLVSPDHGRPIGNSWLPGPNRSVWGALSGPAAADTLEVRLVGVACDARGTGVLVEADGYYVVVSADQLAEVDRSGEVRPGLLVVARRDGPRHLMLVEECSASACRYTVAEAESRAAALRFELAARLEAERREREEVFRREEAERAARQRAGSTAQAQVSGLAQQNLSETLQRYGASETQARAILDRRVIVGMTPAMVRAALGDPEGITQETTGRGSGTVWSYPGRQVVFVDGRVTALR
jgi:hypothetical protein